MCILHTIRFPVFYLVCNNYATSRPCGMPTNLAVRFMWILGGQPIQAEHGIWVGSTWVLYQHCIEFKWNPCGYCVGISLNLGSFFT